METQINEYFADANVQVLGIDQWNGSVSAVETFGENGGVTFPLLTQGGDVAGDYSVDRQYVIVDQEGVVQFVSAQHGFDATEHQQVINQLLENSAAPEEGTRGAAGSFALGEAWPNPFNGTVRVALTLPVRDVVKVRVVDLLGREVAVLSDGVLSAGRHALSWRPHGIASGTYVVQVQARGGQNALRRIVYIK